MRRGFIGARVAIFWCLWMLKSPSLHVDLGGSYEGVHAGLLGVLDSVPGAFQVRELRARQATNDGDMSVEGRGLVADLLCDLLDGRKVVGGGDGKPSLDNIDSEAREAPRDVQLLLDRQGAAWWIQDEVERKGA